MSLASLVVVIATACWLLAAPASSTAAARFCRPGDPCWPSADDVARLSDALDPSLPRSLWWSGAPQPYPLAEPIQDASHQPLYGAGRSLRPVYVQPLADRNRTCFADPTLADEFCLVSTRNNPLFGQTPAFVAWPTTTAHVQAAIAFARAHNLCIAVAGTGHDFQNRHSCDSGLLIRTALFKVPSPIPDASLSSLLCLVFVPFFSSFHVAHLINPPRVRTSSGT